MKRFLSVIICLAMILSFFLTSCSGGEIDRNKELEEVMATGDSKWSQSFPTGSADFDQIADYISGWGENAGLKVTKKAEHYIVLTNPATKGQKKAPSLTISCCVDPQHIRDHFKLLSLAMSSLLGPLQHGRIRLIVTEATDNLYIGAESIPKKYLKCSHYIYLYKGNSDMIYTGGALSSQSELTCNAGRTKPDYQNAFEISMSIPSQEDPYSYDKKHACPNPINVLGDLLASAKSSGRLFEIASFTSEENYDFLPSSAKAVIVIDDNNVEAFRKRFEASLESVQNQFSEMELEEDQKPEELFSYTMTETKMPKRVLRQSACNNIISLMYTLQTGINLQDEDSGAITAASYIRSVSTAEGRFTLNLDLRSRDEASMEEMSSNYEIISGLCDVKYHPQTARRLWTASEDSSLAAWFTGRVNDENDIDTIRLQTTECDTLYAKNRKLDMISYRFKKDHRKDVLSNILEYETGLMR